MRRHREAGVSGGGKYVAGVWAIFLFAFILGMMTALNGSEAGLVIIFIGYGICYVIAGYGMSSSKKCLEQAERERAQRLEKETEIKREALKQEQEQAIQRRIDEAVQAAMAKQSQEYEERGLGAAPSAAENAPLPAAPPAAASPAEPCAVDRSGFSILCPRCGASQRSDRPACYQCGVRFLDP